MMLTRTRLLVMGLILLPGLGLSLWRHARRASPVPGRPSAQARIPAAPTQIPASPASTPAAPAKEEIFQPVLNGGVWGLARLGDEVLVSLGQDGLGRVVGAEVHREPALTAGLPGLASPQANGAQDPGGPGFVIDQLAGSWPSSAWLIGGSARASQPAPQLYHYEAGTWRLIRSYPHRYAKLSGSGPLSALRVWHHTAPREELTLLFATELPAEVPIKPGRDVEVVGTSSAAASGRSAALLFEGPAESEGGPSRITLLDSRGNRVRPLPPLPNGPTFVSRVLMRSPDEIYILGGSNEPGDPDRPCESAVQEAMITIKGGGEGCMEHHPVLYLWNGTAWQDLQVEGHARLCAADLGADGSLWIVHCHEGANRVTIWQVQVDRKKGRARSVGHGAVDGISATWAPKAGPHTEAQLAVLPDALWLFHNGRVFRAQRSATAGSR